MAEGTAPAPFGGLLDSFTLALEAESKSPKTVENYSRRRRVRAGKFRPVVAGVGYTLILAIRFDRGEAVATHLRPALTYLSRIASWRGAS